MIDFLWKVWGDLEREMYRNGFSPEKLAEIAGQIEAFGEKELKK